MFPFALYGGKSTFCRKSARTNLCMKMNIFMNFIAQCFIHNHILPPYQFMVHITPVNIVVKMSAYMPTCCDLLKKYDALGK